MGISNKILDNIFGGEKEDNDETGGGEEAVGEVLLQRGAGRHHQTIHTVLQHQHMYFQPGFMQHQIRRAFKTKQEWPNLVSCSNQGGGLTKSQFFITIPKL